MPFRELLREYPGIPRVAPTLRLLNALNSEDRGLKVRFSLATIVFETFELILCVKYYRRKGKTHLQTPILTTLSAFSSLKGEWPFQDWGGFQVSDFCHFRVAFGSSGFGGFRGARSQTYHYLFKLSAYKMGVSTL